MRLFVAVSLIAFGLLTSLKNPLALALAVPAALLAASYPYMKRWLAMPQAVLGIAFSWGIPMAYAAVQHRVPLVEAGLLMLANLSWVIAYDTYYAMVDRDDDLKIGVRSSAILFGAHDRLAIGVLQGAALALLAVLGYLRALGLAWYVGLGIALLLAVYQLWITRHRQPEACFRAFLHNHYFGAVIFVGLLLDRLG